MKKKVLTPILIIIAALLLIAINIFAAKLSETLSLRLDMTENKLYELSDESCQILSRLSEPVSIKVFSAREEFLPLVAEILDRYRLESKAIDLEYIDPYSHPETVDKYIQKGYEIALNTVLVEGRYYARAIQLKDMFQINSDEQTVEKLNCEQLLTGAVIYASGTESPTVIFTAGHNESSSSALKALFELNNFSVEYMSLSLADIDETVDMVVVAAPSSDFTAEEISKLDSFMTRGGKLLVFAGPTSERLVKLDGFLNEWGIVLTDIVVEEQVQYTDSNPLSIVPLYSSDDINRYFAVNQLNLVMPSTIALKQSFISRGNIRTSKLLYSTDRSFDSGAEEREEAEQGPFTLAIASEKTDGDCVARVCVIGSRGIFSDSLMNIESCANSGFIAQVVKWCAQAENTVSIPPKDLLSSPISVTTNTIVAIGAVLVVILPLLLLADGLFVFLRRRHS